MAVSGMVDGSGWDGIVGSRLAGIGGSVAGRIGPLAPMLGSATEGAHGMTDSKTTDRTIWIDGDAAPRACKEVVYKAAARTQTPAVLVANRHHETPRLAVVSMLQVPGGPDQADDAIAERCGPRDLVVTDDLPLAARALEKGSTVLRFRGEPITEENVDLSIRGDRETATCEQFTPNFHLLSPSVINDCKTLFDSEK